MLAVWGGDLARLMAARMVNRGFAGSKSGPRQSNFHGPRFRPYIIRGGNTERGPSPPVNTEPDFMTSTDALPSGYLLHQYRISKILGGGGFSIVYLARDTRTKQLVVIKEYIPGEQATRRDGETVESLSVDTATTFNTGLKRFLDEASALSKINHPNIVRVIDFFRENNTVYMVMNYEQGKDLRWYIKRHDGRMSEKFIRTVFPQLLIGLRELHSHRLLHLDIKPANVYLRPGGSPLLLDFGAAQSQSVEARSRRSAHADARLRAVRTAHARTYRSVDRSLRLRRHHVGVHVRQGAATGPQARRRDTYKPAVRQFAGRYSRPLLEAVDWCLQMDQLQRPQKVDDLLDFLNKEPAAAPEPPTESFLDRLTPKFWRGRK